MRLKSFLLVFTLLALIGTSAFRPLEAKLVMGACLVTPGSVLNDSPATITITGSGFVPAENPVVFLDTFGALATTLLNSNVLTAVVPAGVPAGQYDVIVKSDVEQMICSPSPALTVSAPNFSRPQIVLDSSTFDVQIPQLNKNFYLTVKYKNVGDKPARNLQIVFTSAEVTPLNGGKSPVYPSVDPYIPPAVLPEYQQGFVQKAISSKARAAIIVTFNYYDDLGKLYSDSETISIRILGSGGGSSGGNNGGGGGGAPATSTPVPGNAPQLIISGYSTNVEELQPGLQFKLNLNIKNMGKTKADRITMIVGGGSTGSGGTPTAGGVSGGGGSFGDFAPVGTSNVQSLGALDAGASLTASQNLIVNVSTEPGAYPLVITFAYVTDKGEGINDDQVITLLVYSLPNLDISFYRPLDPFYVGQSGALPLQIVNLGKRSAVMGNIKVTSEDGTVENGSSLVGSLDPGGYFTLDSLLTPDKPGTLKLDVSIDYTDDFNQPRTYTKTLEVEVLDAPEEIIPDNGSGGGGEMPVEETFLQKVWRFILGLFGLDSAAPGGGSNDATPEPVPAPMGPGGKG